MQKYWFHHYQCIEAFIIKCQCEMEERLHFCFAFFTTSLPWDFVCSFADSRNELFFQSHKDPLSTYISQLCSRFQVMKDWFRTPSLHTRPLLHYLIVDQCFLNFDVHKNYPGILLKCRFWFMRSDWLVCLPNKLPADANAAGGGSLFVQQDIK